LENIKKYKIAKTKLAKKHFETTDYTNTVFCATHFKIPFKKIIEFIQSHPLRTKIIKQIIKFQKYSYKQNKQIILAMKYYGIPLQFKLNQKDKFRSNLKNPNTIQEKYTSISF
jgi:hypothetical protein